MSKVRKRKAWDHYDISFQKTSLNKGGGNGAKEWVSVVGWFAGYF